LLFASPSTAESGLKHGLNLDYKKNDELISI
jgi:hypothetical protein